MVKPRSSRNTVSVYLQRAGRATLGWPIPEGLTGAELEKLLCLETPCKTQHILSNPPFGNKKGTSRIATDPFGLCPSKSNCYKQNQTKPNASKKSYNFNALKIVNLSDFYLSH